MRKIEIIAAVVALAVASPLMAQGRGRGNGGVPPGHRPPAGMCRIWIDGVPPGHQPAPTDCATAAARVPANGRIIYGDDTDGRRGSIYGQNGQVIYGRDGRVIQRGTQGCVQRVDANGHVYTVCNDGTVNGTSSSRVGRIYDGSQTGVSNSRVGRIYDGGQVSGSNTRAGRIYDGSRAADEDRAGEAEGKVKGKAKHHKQHGRGEDNDRN